VRLHVKGTVLGFKRGLRTQYCHTSLIKLDGVADQNEARWYNGKRVAYIYSAPNPKHGKKYRVIWGKVIRPHGSKGVVKAKFKHNLPPQAMGSSVRVMLYPSRA